MGYTIEVVYSCHLWKWAGMNQGAASEFLCIAFLADMHNEELWSHRSLGQDSWKQIKGKVLCFGSRLEGRLYLKGMAWWMPVKSLAAGAGPHRETVKGLGFLKIKS